MQDRPTKRQYYLELAHVVAKRGKIGRAHV